MSNHTYITYSEVFATKATELDFLALLGAVDKESSFIRLSRVCNLLALFPPEEEQDFVQVQRILCRSLLSEKLFERIQNYVQEISLLERPIFHRQQILYVMRRLLTEGSRLDQQLDDDVEIKMLGELCFAANDLLVTEEQERQTFSEKPLEDSESERVMDGLLTQLLPSVELSSGSELRSSLWRTRQYIQLFDAEFLDTYQGTSLTDLVKSLTGISPETFFQMVAEVWATYVQYSPDELAEDASKFNMSSNGYFSTLNHSDEEVAAFYRLSTRTFEELDLLQQSCLPLLPQYDFTLFRRFPLYRPHDNVVTPVDANLLLDKVSNSFYYTILDALNDAEIDPNPFFRAWGRMFEKYVNNVLRSIYPELANRFHPNLFFDTKMEMEAFDGTLEYPDSLIVMEYKGGLLNSTAKYSGNVETLLNELGKTFGRSKKGAIRQLSKKIELLFTSETSKRKKICGLDTSRIKHVYPVVVANELSLSFGLTHFRLRKWFEEERQYWTLDESVNVHPLMIMTIEDLERFYPYLQAGDFSMLDFMQYYSTLDYKRFAGPEHWYEPLTSLMEVFYRFRQERGLAFRPNDTIQQSWETFMDGIQAMFKPEAFDL